MCDDVSDQFTAETENKDKALESVCMCSTQLFNFGKPEKACPISSGMPAPILILIEP